MRRCYHENILYWLVRIFGWLVRHLPLKVALFLGRVIGVLGYYFDSKHRALAYANIKIAFSREKKPAEIRRIVRRLFQNYGQNIIDLLRLPLLNKDNISQYVHIEGKEHLDLALQKGKGVILLAMHFGSWELASFCSAMLNHPYKVIVKPQKRYTRLDELLNNYREAGGSVVIARGLGTRDFVRSLHNNEIIGMVVDQGGKDGALVNFFGRQASLSVGAIRMALKLGTPLCFSIIIREKEGHCLIIHPPLDIINTGNIEEDVLANLQQVVKIMEGYIRRYPAEYMWFYKIWKYAKEAAIIILHDGKRGHLNQSRCMAQKLVTALQERNIHSTITEVEVKFKNKLAATCNTLIAFLSHPTACQGRLRLLKWFLKRESFLQIVKVKADFVISCGSSVAPVNYLLSRDYAAKSIAILRPGILGFNRFDAVILPQHDPLPRRIEARKKVFQTKGAPNLITDEYLNQQKEVLLKRFTHWRIRRNFCIGVLLGGNAKGEFISEAILRLVIKALKESVMHLNADLLLTTSRRTPPNLETIIKTELKKFPNCVLLIIPREKDIPEAVGGILALSDILVVSGDSISMVSEAASSGKKTIVFAVEKTRKKNDRHALFLKKLSKEGYIVLSNEKTLAGTIADMAKNKIHTKRLNDHLILLGAAQKVI